MRKGDDSVDFHALRALYITPQAVKNRIKGTWTNRHVLVSGGAGFVGSHLVDRLMLLGAKVTVIDDFSTGRKSNIAHWLNSENFSVLEHDICILDNVHLDRVDYVFHLASPASPPHYQRDPIKTLLTNVVGTLNILRIAVKDENTKFLLTSTSEVYGDPECHPQCESYTGSVSTTGPRACYDEGKRCAETLTAEHVRKYGLKAVIVRIFNTYGPRMQPDDGRVVSNFVVSALRDEPLVIYGDGKQTRSFQYIHDLIDGMLKAICMQSDVFIGPINIGSPEEKSIEEFAEIVKRVLDKDGLNVVYEKAVVDDPRRRQPDISKAWELLGWAPKWGLEEGLRETVEYFKHSL